MIDLRSGAAVFSTGPDGLIAAWNEEAERLTGIAAAEAEGRHCWDVLAGRDDQGGLICHPGCSLARLARQGWPVKCTDLHVPTAFGARRLTLSTIVVQGGDERLILHPMRDAEAASAPAARRQPEPSLTRRQREILLLLVDGVRAKEIATRLTLSETTVRNHIRAILLELGAHSQLEAVARARALTIVSADAPAA